MTDGIPLKEISIDFIGFLLSTHFFDSQANNNNHNFKTEYIFFR